MKLLARKITLFFIRKGNILEEDSEVYEYHFEMLLSTIFNTVILIVGAIITRRFYETMVFSLSFITIRRCIGGYHSKTHFGCLSLLVIMFILMNLLLLIDYKILNIVSLIFLLISLVFISVLAPVSHPNNPVDKSKKNKKNIIATLVSSIYSIISILTMIFVPKFNISILISFPMICSTVSMIIGYYVYKNVSYE